jgi:hypothetical protein
MQSATSIFERIQLAGLSGGSGVGTAARTIALLAGNPSRTAPLSLKSSEGSLMVSEYFSDGWHCL